MVINGLHEAQDIIKAITIINEIVLFFFSIGWIIHSAKQCWSLSMDYRNCKNTPNLHPIYRDVQYLSQQRKLYNLKTHFVKYVIFITCIISEMSSKICIIIICITKSIQSRFVNNSTTTQITNKYPNCPIHDTFNNIYSFPYTILMYNMTYMLFLLLIMLLCVLTRYLAARYLNNRFHTTLYKYIVWLLAQCSILIICSSLYSFILLYFILPGLFFINWIVLLRDNLFLSRVLKSNLREMKTHTYDRQLYRQQLAAYKFYKCFNIMLIGSMFCVVLTISMYCTEYIMFILSKNMCYFNLVYKLNFKIENSLQFIIIQKFVSFLFPITFFLYSVSSSVPLYAMSSLTLLQKCILRYRYRNNVYRFNYDNIQHLMCRDS